MGAREDFIKKYAGGFYGDEGSLRKRLENIAGEIYDAQTAPTSPEVTGITDNTTLDEADVNNILLVTADAKTITLPATAEGLKYIIANGGANGTVGITISPNANDKIMGAIQNGETIIRLSGTDNKDIVNTTATAKKGDYIILVADGVDGWYIEGGVGVWTEESQVVVGKLTNQVTVTDNTVLTVADSGKVYNIATDAKAFTLPAIAASNIGMVFTFRNTGADDAVALTISPNASDGINGTIQNAAADSVASGVVNKDLVNTRAGANNGDWVRIEAVALTKWFITGGVGVWASEG